MRRVLSLWLPAFATERLRRTQAKAHAAQPDSGNANRPLVLIATQAGRQVLAAVDERAAALGLLPGAALAAARARVPDLLTEAYDPVGDAALLDRIVRWTLRYAPWAAPDPFAGGPGSAGLLIDITGASHLYGDEAALAEDLLARLSRFGHRGFIGLAGTRGGAWALARFAAPPEKKTLIIAPPEKSLTDLLDPLPPAALRLGASALTLLKRFGLETIGALRQVPAAALAPRFGEEVSRRLRQALGEVPEPISPEAPQESLQLRLLLADPSAAPIDRDRALAKLLSDLVPLLEKRGEGVRRLSFTAFRADGTFSEIGIGTSLATRDARHLERLFIAERDKLDPGFGFEAFLLSATRTEPMLAEQGLLPRLEDLKLAAPQETLAALIDRLENRLGEKSVTRPLPEARHRPERAFRLAGPFEKTEGIWRRASPRPLILLRRAEPVEAIALLPDHAPARFTWRRVPHRVIRAEGPERLLPDWWRPAEASSPPRDYFRVEDEAGRRFWLFRAKGASGERWFLQGLFA